MFSKIALSFTTLFAIAVTVNGACDNGCSGHGTCGADDVCSCYPNWRMGDEDSGDCSDRVCPFELAWVDHPSSSGSFHNYAECAGRGLCNRGTGECECFEGYTGKACQRTTCPNDCSGHGTCEYIEELGYAAVHGDYYDGTGVKLSVGNRPVTFENKAWDNHKTMGCVCDPKWTDVDCSRRMCPKGNDVLNTRLDTSSSNALQYQVQKIHFPLIDTEANTFEGFDDLDGSTTYAGGVVNRYFALTFISTLNETYTTKPMLWYKETGTAAEETSSGSQTSNLEDSTGTAKADGTAVSDTIGTMVENALKELPHKVIDDVSVTVAEQVTLTGSAEAYVELYVTFTGSAVQGPQNLLQVEELACGKGCYPYLPHGRVTYLYNSAGTKVHNHKGTATYGGETVHYGGAVIQTATWTNTGEMPYVKEHLAADYNNYECGRRGKCNYGTGLCECFDGYTGESCSTQTALI
jgi:hypothetical protein